METETWENYTADKEFILQQTRSRILQQILANSSGVLSVPELAYRNPSVSESTLRYHLRKLQNRHIVRELKKEEPTQDRFPVKYYAVSKKGILLMQQAGIYEETKIWREIYSKMERSDRIMRIENWEEKPSATWYSEIADPPQIVNNFTSDFPPPDEPQEEGLTIVFVENEPDLANMYEAWAGDEFSNVYTIALGEEAVEFIQNNQQVDIVFVDRLLEEMDGDEVTKEIQALDQDLVVAMLTAIKPGPSVLDIPIDDYVIKPVSRDDLINTINQLARVKEYGSMMRELYSLNSRLQAFKKSVEPEVREKSERYAAAISRFEDLRYELGLPNSAIVEASQEG